jgi:hypothetical protein
LGPAFSAFCGKLHGFWGCFCLVLSQIEPYGEPFAVSERTVVAASTLLFEKHPTECSARIRRHARCRRKHRGDAVGRWLHSNQAKGACAGVRPISQCPRLPRSPRLSSAGGPRPRKNTPPGLYIRQCISDSPNGLNKRPQGG